MGIDRTAEINELFMTHRGKKDSDFVKSIGKHFYGDDLYFFMFKSKGHGGKTTDRKPMGERDPEGVCLLEKILNRYWDLLVWPCNKENVSKSEEIENSAPEIAAKVRRHLASMRQCELEKWMSSAYEWMNDWGTEARKRNTPYFWRKSLFGQSVHDPAAVKPKNYNEEAENEWRQKLLGMRQTKRTYESFVVPPGDNQ